VLLVLLPSFGSIPRHTRTQTSTDKFLDDYGVEDVNRSVGREMPNGVVLGACSSRNDWERVRKVGRVLELQVPF
jgi:hypothetical protein